jgi:hypothetical protein
MRGVGLSGGGVQEGRPSSPAPPAPVGRASHPDHAHRPCSHAHGSPPTCMPPTCVLHGTWPGPSSSSSARGACTHGACASAPTRCRRSDLRRGNTAHAGWAGATSSMRRRQPIERSVRVRTPSRRAQVSLDSTVDSACPSTQLACASTASRMVAEHRRSARLSSVHRLGHSEASTNEWSRGAPLGGGCSMAAVR